MLKLMICWTFYALEEGNKNKGSQEADWQEIGRGILKPLRTPQSAKLSANFLKN